MFDPILNFSYSLVATAPSPADTGNTLQISNVDKDLFPDPSTDGAYNATVWVSGEIPKISNATIIRITGKSVGATYTTLTFTRTQEGSNNRDILVGDQIMVSVTKKRFDDITTEIITSRNLSAGCATSPTYTDNGSGNITVNAVTVRMFSTSDFTGYINSYSLSPITVTLTDGTTNYVVADYNSGTPILKVITDVSLINESNIIPVFTIIRTGTVLHTLDWDRLGLGLSNKLHQRLVKTERFTRESGLSLTETGTRNLVLTSGVVWYGATQKSLSQIATATDKIVFYYHSSGNWVSDFTGTQYNNTQYDDGTNLVTLTANRYAVNWLFRGVEDQKHLYMILGSGDYTLTQAQAAVLPTIPPIISAHAILVAKLIVQKSATTATSIQSAFETAFSFSSASAHNDLIGIQGGTTNEYYHLTSAQYNTVDSNQHYLQRQAIINGNFDIWQRGSSINLSDVTITFQADRWLEYVDKNGGTLPTLTRSRQLLTSGDIPNSFYYTRLATNGAGTSLGVNSYHTLIQKIENGTRFLCGNGKKVTMSFYARSSITNKRICPFLSQSYGTGGSPTADEIITGTPITLTSTWTKYTVTFTTNTLVGKTFGTNNNDNLQASFWLMWGDTIGDVVGATGVETYVGSGNIDIAQVQLCAGDVALPFMPKSAEEELKSCLRYYRREGFGVNGVSLGMGLGITGSRVDVPFKHIVPLRANPTAINYANLSCNDAGAAYAITSIISTASTPDNTIVQFGFASGITANRPYVCYTTSTSGYIEFVAEL